MFSWKKPDPEPERVNVEELAPILNQIFNGKLGRLESNLSGVPRELEKLKADFTKACGDFEKLEAEPDTESMWNPNINAIKSQKAAYSIALKNIIVKLRTEPGEAPNAYASYKILFIDVEDSLNTILRYNSNFKTTLYCYANHLRDFKKVFSSVEAVCGRIKEELDRKEEDYNTFNSISSDISKLKATIEEINALKNGISALEASLNGNNQEVPDKSGEETAGMASAKRLEISAAAEQLSSVTSRISMLTVPLEKASRKFDHMSEKKMKLGSFIDDPIASMRSEEDHKTFVTLLNELSAAVDSGSVDIKNKADVKEAVSRLINSDIYHDIRSLESIKERINELETEWKELDQISRSIKAGMDSRMQAAKQIENMNAEIKKIVESQERLKAAIEKRFSDSYSRSISISIG